MPKNEVIAATDGSALGNPNGPAGWAWVIDKQRWNSGGFPKASNQVAEMYAILMVLKEVPVDVPLRIQTDSAFSVNMLGDGTKKGWMHSWKPQGSRTEWLKKDGKVPANLQLVIALDKALSARKAPTVLEWVKGHSTHQLNNIADRLCTRVTAAIKDGKDIPTGPGWSGNAGLGSKSTPAPVVTTVPQRRATSPSKPLSKPVGTRRSSAPVRRSRTATKEVLVTSFLDEDDESYTPIKKPSRGKTVLCTSCDTPINPLTMECGKCSR